MPDNVKIGDARFTSLDLLRTPVYVMLVIVDEHGSIWAQESLPVPPAQRSSIVSDDYKGRLPFVLGVRSFLSVDADLLAYILGTSLADEDGRCVIESLREQLLNTLKDRKDSSNECAVRTKESSQGHGPRDGG